MTGFSALETEWDVVVVGGGPAGMSAATVLQNGGAKVALIDEQIALGGQIYRDIERNLARGRDHYFGPDYQRGKSVIDAFHRSGAPHVAKTFVWNIDRDGTVWIGHKNKVRAISSRFVLLATGAMERPAPVSGWTSANVMTSGAIQTLVKSGVLPEQKSIAFIGTGPLHYLVIQQLAQLGVRPAYILDTATRQNPFSLLPEFLGSLNRTGIGYLAKGMRLLASERSYSDIAFRHVHDVAIADDGGKKRVSFKAGTTSRTIEADIVALHEGVIPGQQAGRMIGCDHFWDESQAAFRPRTSENGLTTVDGVWIAGDAGGISGAISAEIGGALSGYEILEALGNPIDAEAQRRIAQLRNEKRSHRAIRPLLEKIYRPRSEILHPPANVVACRCEAVEVGQIRDLAARGLGPNQIKSLTRCGMGPCQGRNCGPTVSMTVARQQGKSLDEAGYFNIRPPLKPLPMDSLANIQN